MLAVTSQPPAGSGWFEKRNRKQVGADIRGRVENIMLINLTGSVPLKEFCKITATGSVADAARKVEFTFSHEAMIGFATELLWMYKDISVDRKLILATHQLKLDPSPNQVIGFYLTSDSPMLVLKVNSLSKENEEGSIYKKCKEINIWAKNTEQYYNVKDPTAEDIEVITLEPYELSRRNLVRIKVFDSERNDITSKCHTVILEVNREGIKDLASMMLVWAANYKEGIEYRLPHVSEAEQGYNLGIILTRDSIPSIFKAHDLGVAHDYDPNF